MAALLKLLLVLAAYCFWPGNAQNSTLIPDKCVSCYIASCDLHFIIAKTTGCTNINAFMGAVSLAKPGSCQTTVLQDFCRFYTTQSQRNFASGCLKPAGGLCMNDCKAIDSCLELSVMNCPSPLITSPPGVCAPFAANASTQAINATFPPRSCPNSAAPGASDAQIMVAELGPLASVVANYSAYPGFPRIQLVALDRPFSTLFPAVCQNIQMLQPDYPNYAIAMLIYTIIIFGFAVAFIYHRNKPIIVVRHVPLNLAFNAFAFISIALIFVLYAYAERASCLYDLLLQTYIATMAAFFFLCRALHLLFMYRWYFRNRWLVTWKGFAPLFAVHLAITTALFCYFWFGFPEAVQVGILQSGRCLWWDINPQVVAAAKKYGITNLGPNPANPDGYTPYSPHFSSCQFCTIPDSAIAWATAYRAILMGLIVVCAFMMRNINDQYWIRKELLLVSFVIVVPYPVTQVSSFASVGGTNALLSGGIPWGELLTIVSLCGSVIASMVIPVVALASRAFAEDDANSRSRISSDTTSSFPLSVASTGRTPGKHKHRHIQQSDRREMLMPGQIDTDEDPLRAADLDSPTAARSALRQDSIDNGTLSPKGAKSHLLPSTAPPSDSGTAPNSVNQTSTGVNVAVKVASAGSGAADGKSSHATTATQPLSPRVRRRPKEALRVMETIDKAGKVVRTMELRHVETILTDELALPLARQCAMEMFVIESVAFFLAVKKFHHDCKSMDAVQAWAQALEIYRTYIVHGADLEINVSSVCSSKIHAHFSAGSAAAPPQGLSVARIRRLFDEAYLEIVQLLQSNLLPRFKSSKYFAMLMKLVAERTAAAAASGQVEVLAHNDERRVLTATNTLAAATGTGSPTLTHTATQPARPPSHTQTQTGGAAWSQTHSTHADTLAHAVVTIPAVVESEHEPDSQQQPGAARTEGASAEGQPQTPATAPETDAHVEDL